MRNWILNGMIGLIVLLPWLAWGASPYDLPARWAAGWLEQVQNPDGSWGASDDIKPLATSEAVMALASIQRRTPAYYRGITWLENHYVPNLDYRARVGLALWIHRPSLGISYDPETRISANNTPPGIGGWGLSNAYQSSALDTALALQEAAYRTDYSSALTYLKATQLTSGNLGWALAHEGIADPITTAHVVAALVEYRSQDSTLTTPIANAVSALTNLVNTGSSSLVKGLTARALLADNNASSTAASLLNSLVTAQSSDGSWGQDIHATATAIRAMAAAMGTSLAAQGQPVLISDFALRSALNQALGKNLADALTWGELASLTSLNAAGKGITSLVGLEAAVNLTSLDLRNNNISDISILASLPNLERVYLAGNPLNGTPDTDGDGATDGEEFYAGTNPFRADIHPIFHPLGDVLGFGPVRSSLAGTGALLYGWHAVWADFDGDGDSDAVAYIHGADEQPYYLDCVYDCPYPVYYGPSRGKLAIFENVGTATAPSFVLRSLNTGEDRPNGDITELLAFDYDNDGKKDLLMVLHPVVNGWDGLLEDSNQGHREIVLYRNDSNEAGHVGFHLSDVTQTVGLSDNADLHGAVVLDIDRDGFLDIFAAGGSTSTRLWRFNSTTGAYVNVLATSLLPSSGYYGATVGADLNRDGLIDIVTQGGSNGLRFFKNNGNGTFTEKSNVSSLGQLYGTWIDRLVPVDYNNDGETDLALLETMLGPGYAYVGQRVRLLKNRGNPPANPGEFDMVEEAVPGLPGSGGPYTTSLPFSGPGSVGVGDYDNDGRSDLIMNGAIFRNNADGTFADQDLLSGIPTSGNVAPVFGDYNGDGKLDLFLPDKSQPGLASYLYTNLGNNQHSVFVNLVGRVGSAGSSSSRDAVGARVEVQAGGVARTQHVRVEFGRGLRLHVGLGAATIADQVTVYWPSGATTTRTNVPADTVVTINEP